MLYQIGEFSKITNTSIQTLRYYDSINLFKPCEVDLFTNYRYYSDEQIKDLELINTLKNVGFSLDEIKNNWDNFNVDFFQNKKNELLREIEVQTIRIKQIDKLKSKIIKGKIVDNYKFEDTLMIKSKFNKNI